jgi:hypothetical protein
MWRWCAYLSGVLLIAVALVALPSAMIAQSYVGWSATHGSVEDGRYFVNPGHAQPIAEVSESTWRAVYWVERLQPWSALIPCWIGMLLMAYGMGPNWKPPPPPNEMPPWVLRVCCVSAGLAVAWTWLSWVVFRTPWVVQVVGCVLLYISVGSVTWLWTRSLREQPTAEPGAAPDPARPS